MRRSSEIGVKRLHSAMSNLFDEVDHIKWIRCRFQAGDSCGSSGRQFIYINYWEDKLYTYIRILSSPTRLKDSKAILNIIYAMAILLAELDLNG